MKITKKQLKEIIKEVIITEAIDRTPQWYLSKLSKVKFPSGILRLMRTTKKGDYRWGYVEIPNDPHNFDTKIFFYKNKPVVGAHVTMLDITNLTYLTNKHIELEDGQKLPTKSYSEWESDVFGILQKYKIGQ